MTLGTANPATLTAAERADAIHRIVVEVATRLSSNGSVDIERIVAENPELMPELGDELQVQMLAHREALAVRRTTDRPASDADWAMVLPADVPSTDPLRSANLHSAAGRSADLQSAAGPAHVADGYRVTGPPRRGGQATVYPAVFEETGRPVALKVLGGGAKPGDRRLARLDREVGILATLDHPNIVNVVRRGNAADGSYFVAMSYVDGPELDEWVSGRSVGEVLRLFVAVCEAAGAAHAGKVVHRDFKPSNVRVDHRGEPHLLDFGLARLAGDDHPDDPDAGPRGDLVTREGHVVGSLPWMSPEQAEGLNDQVDARSDVYALGVMLHEALTGRHVVGRHGSLSDRMAQVQHEVPEPPSRYRAGVSPAVDAVVMKALAKRREDRYADAAEMAADLRACVAGETVHAPRYRRPRRVPVMVLAAAAAAAMVLLSVGLTVWLAHRGGPVVGGGGGSVVGDGGGGGSGGEGSGGVAVKVPPPTSGPTTDKSPGPALPPTPPPPQPPTKPVPPPPPREGKLTFRPSKDAFVRGGESYAKTKYGAHTDEKTGTQYFRQLQVKNMKGMDRYCRDAYLEFDTSALPANCKVRSAKLWLHGTAIAGETLKQSADYTMFVGAYPLQRPAELWLGTTITWETRPFLAGWDDVTLAKGSATVSTGESKWYEMDLTKHVAAERAAGRRTFTIGLHAAVSNDLLAQFDSVETSNSPTLVVEYGPP